MLPFYGRVGSKNKILKQIKLYIPDHSIYIEAFLGGASLFFGLLDNEISKNKVINDIDFDLIQGYIALQNADLNKTYVLPEKLEDKILFLESNNNIILKTLLLSNNTFGNQFKGKLYRNYNHKKKLQNIDKYKLRLENTIILSEDYKIILEKYDSNTSFFFLDPPYEDSKKLYRNSEINYYELLDSLQKLQGNFLLCINDSINIRNIFNQFNIIEIDVQGTAYNGSNIGRSIRKELFILNYTL